MLADYGTSRFMTLLSHLLVSIVLFLSRPVHIIAALPLSYRVADYEAADAQ